VVFGVQLLLSGSAYESIRNDEFKRYLREDRIDWVEVGPDQIDGAFKPDQAPALHSTVDQGASSASYLFRTLRVHDDELVQTLEAHDVAFSGQQPSMWASYWPLLLLLFGTFMIMTLLGQRMRTVNTNGGPLGAFQKNRGRLAMLQEVRTTFADVAGADEIKQELRELVDFLSAPTKYARLGARMPKGVLMVGPPGTGKTLLARAVAGEAKVPFISVSGSEFVEMLVGVGAARVRDLFQEARRRAPCIIFVDELDAIGRSRSGAAMGGATNEEREHTLNQLLVEMDGFHASRAVIVIAATNQPDVLDRALLRPGRFDRRIHVEPPGRAGRVEILRLHSRHLPLAPDVDLDGIAACTAGLTGADLASLINEAALLAARRNSDHVWQHDISQALERIVGGHEKRSLVISFDERRRVAIHEAGHAIAATCAGCAETVHKISLVPRSLGALGYTMQVPSEDRYLATVSDLRARLVALMGGRAAEALMLNEPSTGSQDDLRKATEMAVHMVTDQGMSRRIGPVVVGRTSPLLLGYGMDSRPAGSRRRTPPAGPDRQR
jgi:cell division protease FtsH